MTKDDFKYNKSARLCSVLGRYEMEIRGTSVAETLKDLALYKLPALHIEDLATPDEALLQRLLQGVEDHKEAIHQLMMTNLPPEWPLPRLELLVKIIVEIAVYEFLLTPDLHPKILINEYVNLAAGFYEGKELTFINGLLNQLARKVRPESFLGE